MESGEERGAGRGTTISLQIPASDPDLYSSKATDDVLLFLSRHRFDAFSIGELARQIDHTKPTVTRAVDALEANDLVLDAPAGNRRQIQINRERLSVPEDPQAVLDALENAEDAFEGRTQELLTPEAGTAARNSKARQIENSRRANTKCNTRSTTVIPALR